LKDISEGFMSEKFEGRNFFEFKLFQDEIGKERNSLFLGANL